MRDEYGISLSGLDELHSMNAVILAVPHAEYEAAGADRLCAMVADGGIFVDVKSKFGPEQLRPGLAYWSL
jgi:UDP-N-acetyl-D-galactosamine dehydrogenase